MYKTILLTAILFNGVLYCSGQTTGRDTLPPVDAATSAVSNEDREKMIFDKVEIEASFPGGDEGWRKYMEKTLNPLVPVEGGAPEGTYTVIVQFIVALDGKISNVKALTSHGFGMEKEVIRVIKAGPNWNPAIQDGRPVKAYRKQPVTFQITVEKRKRKNRD